MRNASPVVRPYGHVPETAGHVAEIAGHDPETAGHLRPKYAAMVSIGAFVLAHCLRVMPHSRQLHKE
jgi:hypothetical protein